MFDTKRKEQETYSSEHDLVFIANLDALISATIAENVDEDFVVGSETFHGFTKVVTVCNETDRGC